MLNQHQIDRVVELAKSAGSAIMKIYAEDDFGVKLKTDDSPLTRADLAAHKVIVAGLEDLNAGFPILSEESADIDWETRKKWETYWLVDPLDGTKEFIKRNGEFTVNIALVHQGEPVFGVVYAPDLKKLYWGLVGQSAYCNDAPIKAAAAGTPETLRVVGSRSHQSDAMAEFLDALAQPHEIVPMGSSLKICLVATGDADLYPRLGPTSEWDTAAAHAVAVAAGAQVTEIDPDAEFAEVLKKAGRPLRYNQKESLLNPYFLVRAS